MTDEPKSNKKRLPKAAQEIVYTRLIAGASNAEALQALHDAGYPSDLDHSSLYYYRSSKRVKDGLALAAHEEYQSGFGPQSARIAYCKWFLRECLRRCKEGRQVEVPVPEERGMDGNILTPAGSRWERQDLPALEFQRLANVGTTYLMQLASLIEGPNGIYKGAIKPAEEAEKAAAEAAKSGGKKASPFAHLTKTQSLAFFNDMLETILNANLGENEELLSAMNLAPPSPPPSVEIPAGPEDDDDFGDDFGDDN